MRGSSPIQVMPSEETPPPFSSARVLKPVSQIAVNDQAVLEPSTFARSPMATEQARLVRRAGLGTWHVQRQRRMREGRGLACAEELGLLQRWGLLAARVSAIRLGFGLSWAIRCLG
ncbi:hypothetical protein ERO13_D02G072800v2 [Gossypium hirsutum]|nr:hypothetical protein ERO13_D02G072800v2 [Gossypium hirsutum]